MPENKCFIMPYKRGSASAKQLAQALDAKLLKIEGTSAYRHKDTNRVINWGRSDWPPNFRPVPCLNTPNYVSFVSNKRSLFEDATAQETEQYMPCYWIDKDDIPDDAFPIVCRTILNSHSGRGIHIASNRNELVDAPLYVQYVKKAAEYRIHLGRTIDNRIVTICFQQKRRRLDVPDNEVNWQVRNHANGFIYARENVSPPRAVLDAAQIIFQKCTGLDFGAVDVIYNERQGRSYVLEINTAPGLEGQTVNDYANFFRTYWLSHNYNRNGA